MVTARSSSSSFGTWLRRSDSMMAGPIETMQLGIVGDRGDPIPRTSWSTEAMMPPSDLVSVPSRSNRTTFIGCCAIADSTPLCSCRLL